MSQAGKLEAVVRDARGALTSRECRLRKALEVMREAAQAEKTCVHTTGRDDCPVWLCRAQFQAEALLSETTEDQMAGVDQTKPLSDDEATAARMAREIRTADPRLDPSSCAAAARVLTPYVQERNQLRALLERVRERASGPQGLLPLDPLMAEIEQTIGTWSSKRDPAPPKADIT